MNIEVIEVSGDQLDAPWALCVGADGRAILFLRKTAEVPVALALLRIA